jgi:hypothetical protein
MSDRTRPQNGDEPEDEGFYEPGDEGLFDPEVDLPIDTEELIRDTAPDVVLVEDELLQESPFSEDVGEEISDFLALSASANADEVIDEIGRHTLDDDIRDEFAERQRLAYGSDELALKLRQNPLESPEIAADDIDAAWDYSAVGEELPGGSVATPDQDVVDDIGEAVGLTYEDDEPLNGAAKVKERDEDRWELNPASAEEDPTLGIRFSVDDLDPDDRDEPIVGPGLDLDDDDRLPGEDELAPYEEDLEEIDKQIEEEDGFVP